METSTCVENEHTRVYYFKIELLRLENSDLIFYVLGNPCCLAARHPSCPPQRAVDVFDR